MNMKFGKIGSWLGPIIGLSGICLAFYFHSKSIQQKVPTYYVEPVRAKIVDVSGTTASELRILYKGKPVVKRNVSAILLRFWNDGRMPIRAADVLESLAFEIGAPEDTAEILEARILILSRPVTKFQIGHVKRSQGNSLPIYFDILEKSDGAAVQIIYAGNPDAKVLLKGTIIGVNEPKFFDASSDNKFRNWKGAGFFCMAIGLLFSIFPLIGWLAKRRKYSIETRKEVFKREYRTGIIIGIFAILIGCALVSIAYRYYSIGIPYSISNERIFVEYRENINSAAWK